MDFTHSKGLMYPALKLSSFRVRRWVLSLRIERGKMEDALSNSAGCSNFFNRGSRVYCESPAIFIFDDYRHRVLCNGYDLCLSSIIRHPHGFFMASLVISLVASNWRLSIPRSSFPLTMAYFGRLEEFSRFAAPSSPLVNQESSLQQYST